MKGDFSRDTFDHKKHYRRVLMQQGRVQVDADWNEQASILLHYMQSLAKDIIGHYGKPSIGPDGEPLDDFRIVGDGDEVFKDLGGVDTGFLIGPGHYYVDGLLCENEKWINYKDQPGGPLTDISKLTTGGMFVYLDVWERHVAWYEEASKSMREAALGPYGPDTATRSQLVWQAKIYELTSTEIPDGTNRENSKTYVKDLMKKIKEFDKPITHLRARAEEQSGSGDKLCAASPSAKYLGLENQLYRVEIHQGTESGKPSFKWSRDNGSLVFPVIEGEIRFPNDTNGKKMCVKLSHLGLDESKALKKGDWVEFVHEDYVLQNRAESLLQVENIDLPNMVVTLVTKGDLPDTSNARQPILRRWDQCENKNSDIGPEGDIPIKPDWINIEDGIQIKFEEPKDNTRTLTGDTSLIKQHYRTGDYWLIPARAATKDIEWPGETVGVSRHGVEHHYAPLAVLKKGNATWNVDTYYNYDILDIKNFPIVSM